MADVQVEHGYTRIANTLYEALIRADLPGRHQAVVHALVRLTFGFNRREDRIAASQITGLTGIATRHLRPILADLEAARIVIRGPGKPGHPRPMRVEKDFERWGCGARGSPAQRTPVDGTCGEKGSPAEGAGGSPAQGTTGSPAGGTVQRQKKKTLRKTEEPRASRGRPPPPESLDLAIRLGRRARDSVPGCKLPGTPKGLASWAAEVDRLHRLDNSPDGWPWETIGAVIDWLPTHVGSNGFRWGAQILSPTNLRKHFARLVAEMRAARDPPRSRGGKPNVDMDYWRARREAQGGT